MSWYLITSVKYTAFELNYQQISLFYTQKIDSIQKSVFLKTDWLACDTISYNLNKKCLTCDLLDFRWWLINWIYLFIYLFWKIFAAQAPSFQLAHLILR